MSEQLAAFSHHLAARREAVLQAWHRAASADPEQTTGRALTRGQFLDHIPQILDAFELKLRSQPGGPRVFFSLAASGWSSRPKDFTRHGALFLLH